METNWMYLKESLTSSNAAEVHEALVAIKDSVIGSNKQKSILISYNILPILINICKNKDDITNKMEALIIIGSIAKGTTDNVRLLVKEYDILTILKEELTLQKKYKYCLEICLSTLCSILHHFPTTISEFFDDTCNLTYFLSLTFCGNSLKTQIYVTTILSLLCKTKRDQKELLDASAIPNFVRLINLDNGYLQIPVLQCLCRMSFQNRSVSDNVCVTSFHGRSLLDMLNSFVSRSFPPDIQLYSAKCLTYIYRSGTLLPSDFRILHRTLPCLIRLCSENYNLSVRGSAAETLAYLIELDAELQKTAAVYNHMLESLFQLFKLDNTEIKYASLKCIAALGANDEMIREQIINTNNIINDILESLNSWEIQVRIASARCLHSLSRSVHQLRTTFQDHAIWEPLLHIIDNDTSTDFLIVITATFCNLLLEFSPAKIPLVSSGIIEKLVQLSDLEEPSLRLNCVWALMNLSYQCEDKIKTDIIDTFGLHRILRNLNKENSLILLKTLGLLRNLTCSVEHIDLLMTTHSKEMLDSLSLVLEHNVSSEIKEQVLCILGNIASTSQKDYITSNSTIMGIICDLLSSSETKLVYAALHVIKNVVLHCEGWVDKSYLDNICITNIIKRLRELNKSLSSTHQQSNYLCKTLEDIVIKCNKIYPEIFN